jgi:hypothetical protein
MLQITLKIANSFLLRQSRDFSCLTCPFPWDLAGAIRQWAKTNIPEKILTGDGYEQDIHVTLLYGLHGHDPIEIRQIIWDFGPIEATLGKISLFENGKEDVVKIEVESPSLVELNKIISDKFENTKTHSEYIPHTTLAYIKPGLGMRYIGDDTFAGRKVLLTEVVYSGNDYRETRLPFKPQNS